MRKHLIGIIVAVVLTAGAGGFTAPEVGAEDSVEVELTDEQKDEMRSLQMQTFEQKKEIINKYVEYGVFTEEKGQKIKSHMDECYNKLEENRFIPKWDKKHGKHGEKETNE